MSENVETEVLEMTKADIHIAEINPYTFRSCDYPRKRINILLPSINPEHVFGGISTALKFFEQLAGVCKYDRRIILVDAEPTKEARDMYSSDYVFVKPEEEKQDQAQIVPYSVRAAAGIPVSANDYFMFTGWWTAHCAQEAYQVFEKETGLAPYPFLYFIQDYEPGFYAWSTRYLLADATYRSDYKQIAVFNTKLLNDYFVKNGYSFFQEFYFDPVLNAALKDRLYRLSNSIDKKKQLLIYGRPGTDRNAFSLIVAALKKWVLIQKDIEDWTLLSAGESFAPIDLGKGNMLQSAGKLTIDEYADVLCNSYAGISLMASPHPSYPPLEMSVFGVKVITNTFVNKDLHDFNENIISLDNINPVNIAKHLELICNNYRPSVDHKIVNGAYCENDDVFGFIREIKTILECR